MRARNPGSGDPTVEPRARSERVGRALRPTMVDVANEAGVSQTTVSLVLNQADGARLIGTDARASDQGSGQARLSTDPPRRRPGIVSRHDDRLRLRRDFHRSMDLDRLRRRARKSLGARIYRHGDGHARRRRNGGAGMAQFASQPLMGLDLRDHQYPSDPRTVDAAANSDGPVELSRFGRNGRLDRACGSRGRTYSHRLPVARRAIGASPTSTASRAWKPPATA